MALCSVSGKTITLHCVMEVAEEEHGYLKWKRKNDNITLCNGGEQRRTWLIKVEVKER